MEKTTIQISLRTKIHLMQIKGELLEKDGKKRTFDDVIQDLIYYWKMGKKRSLRIEL